MKPMTAAISTRMPERMKRIMETVQCLEGSEAPGQPGVDRRHEDAGALVDPGSEGEARRRGEQRNGRRDLRDGQAGHMRKLLHAPDIAFRAVAKKSHDAA